MEHLAREFGAMDVSERGEEAVERVRADRRLHLAQRSSRESLRSFSTRPSV